MSQRRARNQFIIAVLIILGALTVAGILAVDPAGAQPIPAEDRTLVAVDPNCNQVTVRGTGWEPTEATVELATRPADVTDEREGLSQTKQVFPTRDNRIEATIPVPDVPGGRFVVVVLVDNMLQDPHTEPFTIPVCSELPFTGPEITFHTVILAMILILAGVLALLMTGRKPRG